MSTKWEQKGTNASRPTVKNATDRINGKSLIILLTKKTHVQSPCGALTWGKKVEITCLQTHHKRDNFLHKQEILLLTFNFQDGETVCSNP